MTIETKRHPYRQLAGKGFVSLRETSAFVSDDLWERALGLLLVLPGGAEVDVDDAELDRALEDIEECDQDWTDAAMRRGDLFAIASTDLDHTGRLEILVPVILNDVDLPPARLLVRLSDLMKKFQGIDPGDGVFARGASTEREMSRCEHQAHEIGRHHCRSCMRRFWMIRAREKGLIDG